MHATLIPQRAQSADSALDIISDDLARLRTWLVNLYFVGKPGGDWTLVDTGVPFWADEIADLAEQRFGRPPRAIVLTHGHFDHVGNVKKLAERWDVEVWAHHLELPYLTGRSDYPPPDPSVGGGSLARTSFVFPKSGIDLGERVHALPTDGYIPPMPGWQTIFTPGHTPGHVSFWRDSDRALIAGDAFIATQQESLLSVVTQKEVMHGPPMYFTQDWESARQSVRTLASLHPDIALTGHGPVMRGEHLRDRLRELADNFDEMARPRDGRYVREPARADERGTYYVPPPVADPVTMMIKVGAVAAVAAVALKVFAPRHHED